MDVGKSVWLILPIRAEVVVEEGEWKVECQQNAD